MQHQAGTDLGPQAEGIFWDSGGRPDGQPTEEEICRYGLIARYRSTSRAWHTPAQKSGRQNRLAGGRCRRRQSPVECRVDSTVRPGQILVVCRTRVRPAPAAIDRRRWCRALDDGWCRAAGDGSWHRRTPAVGHGEYGGGLGRAERRRDRRWSPGVGRESACRWLPDLSGSSRSPPGQIRRYCNTRSCKSRTRLLSCISRSMSDGRPQLVFRG